MMRRPTSEHLTALPSQATQSITCVPACDTAGNLAMYVCGSPGQTAESLSGPAAPGRVARHPRFVIYSLPSHLPLHGQDMTCQVMHTYPCFTCRYMRNITIPAAFITATAGDALKNLLKSDNGEPKEVVAVMDWNDVLPRAEKVSWEFWSNSNDQCGPLCDVQKEFIKVSWPCGLPLLQAISLLILC